MCVLWYVITAHSHIRGATTGAGCLYGSCWCDYQRRWANIAKSSKHTSSIWLLHNYYMYNVKPKYPLISYVDVCLMAVLYTYAGDECYIITIEWWYGGRKTMLTGAPYVITWWPDDGDYVWLPDDGSLSEASAAILANHSSRIRSLIHRQGVAVMVCPYLPWLGRSISQRESGNVSVMVN